MNPPVTSTMREFVTLELENITKEHHKIISGWNSVPMTDENVSHLHNLFKACNKHHVRVFEESNFLGNEYRDKWDIATLQLKQKPLVEEPVAKAIESDPIPVSKKKKKSKKQNDEVQQVPEVKNEPAKEEQEVVSTEKCATPEKPKDDVRKAPSDSVESAEIQNLTADLQESKSKFNELDEELKKVSDPETPANDDHLFAKPQMPVKSKPKKYNSTRVFWQNVFSRKPVVKNAPVNILSTLQDRYISAESNNLKRDLQKLATDISEQEQTIKENMSSGKETGVDNGVLADFISRANTVLKETEAVTVRKIAEAETRKFLSSVNVTSEPYLESISNELMHDIWPKTNQWRTFARNEEEKLPTDPKTKKKQEDAIEKAVHSAIKSAGEPLTKKQIGQIRRAAVVYRDFDQIEQKELDDRSNQTLKLAEYVSAYEATNQMDELTRLRLAIAFCTKRRDHFLKARPKNFMQFSYMYIYLLEKINSKSASVCACLNQRATQKTEFDELEEVMLNLFHEDYFLADKE